MMRPDQLHWPGIRQGPGQWRNLQRTIQQPIDIAAGQRLGFGLLQDHFHPFVVRQFDHERRPGASSQRRRLRGQKLDKLLGDFAEFRRVGSVVAQENPHQRPPLRVAENLHQYRKGAADQ
ncbi:hypothetical protein D9M71_780460 [compost metagenome]